jgi:hypothetical protein
MFALIWVVAYSAVYRLCVWSIYDTTEELLFFGINKMKEEEKHFSDFYAEIGLNSSQWRLS